MADGVIDLKVNLETKNAEMEAKQLQNRIQGIFNSGKPMNKQMESLHKSMKDTYQKSVELSKKMDELANKKVPTDEYARLKKEADKVTAAEHKMAAQHDKLTEKLRKLREQSNQAVTPQLLKSIEDTEDALADLEEQIKPVRKEMVKLNDAVMELEDSGEHMTLGKNTQAYADMEQQLDGLNDKMRLQVLQADGASMSFEKFGQSVLRTVPGMSRAAGFFERFGTMIAAHPVIASFAAGIALAVVKLKLMLTVLKKLVSGVLKTFISELKLLAGILPGIISIFGKFISLLGSAFNKVLSLTTGVSGLSGAFSWLKSAVTEGIKSLAQVNGGVNSTNQALSMLLSSLTQMKNAWAAAFAPILTVVAPLLNYLIQLLTKAADILAQFFSALTGKSTYTYAKKVNMNYAASLDKTAKNTKKAKDETEKLLDKLGEYDELKLIQQEPEKPETPETPDGGGGAGGLSPDDMFGTKNISKAISDWVKALKDAWNNEDWDWFYDQGRLLGEKLKQGFSDAADWLRDVLRPIAHKAAMALSSFLNGLIEVDGLGRELGRMLGEAFNVAIEFLDTFITNFHWFSLGQLIGDGLMSAIMTIDWKSLGHLLAEGINGIFDVIGGFAQSFKGGMAGLQISRMINEWIDTLNPQEAAQNLSNLLQDILDMGIMILKTSKWGELGTKFGQFLEGILGDKLTWGKLGTLLKESWNSLWEFFSKTVEELKPEEIGEAIANFINNTFEGLDLAKATSTISQLIIKLLEIASNAIKKTNWTQVGIAIQDGLDGMNWNGIFSAALQLAGQLLWAILQTKFAMLKEKIKNYILGESHSFDWVGIVQGLVDGLLACIPLFGPVYLAIKSVFETILNVVKAVLGIHSPSTVFAEIGSNIVEGLLQGLESLREKLLAWWEDIKNAIHEKVEALKEGVKQKWEAMKARVSEIVDGIKTAMQEKWQWIKDKVVELVENTVQWVTDRWNDAKETLQGVWETIKSTAQGAWEGLKTIIFDVIGQILGKIISFVGESIRKIVELKNALAGVNEGGIGGALAGGIAKVQSAAAGNGGGMSARMKRLLSGQRFAPDMLMAELDSFAVNSSSPISNFFENAVPLATGAVIPPNREFAAILGDQKQGLNIETPLQTMIDAFNTALAQNGIGGSNQPPIVLQLNGKTIAQAVWDEEEKQYKQNVRR